MSTAFMVKHLGSLRPADEQAEVLIKRLWQGEIVEVEIRRPRNIKFHRKFWALMNIVWDNIDHDEYPTVEALVTRLKIDTGHRETMLFDGVIAYIPKSINFASMDASQFDEFFERCSDWIASHVLPGVTQQELREEIEGMIGARVGA